MIKLIQDAADKKVVNVDLETMEYELKQFRSRE